MLKNKKETVIVKDEINSKKKRSKFIIDILNGNITVSDSLYKLKVLLSDLNNKTVSDWIEAELTGYKSSDGVPEYRKFDGQVFGNIQQGYTLYSNINIPIKNEYKHILDSCITEDITTVENFSKSDNDKELGKPLDLGVINLMAGIEMNQFTQVIHATFVIPPSIFTEIISNVKKTILDILMDLERNYGNLDEYYIGFNDKREKEKVAETIINYIKIGDNNKIVNSNIGEDNEN